jgi:hypothetical protein
MPIYILRALANHLKYEPAGTADETLTERGQIEQGFPLQGKLARLVVVKGMAFSLRGACQLHSVLWADPLAWVSGVREIDSQRWGALAALARSVDGSVPLRIRRDLARICSQFIR